MSQFPTTCPECGKAHLRWQKMNINNSQVQDGRLKTGDIDVQFFLGCDYCSETIETISSNYVLYLLGKMK